MSYDPPHLEPLRESDHSAVVLPHAPADFILPSGIVDEETANLLVVAPTRVNAGHSPSGSDEDAELDDCERARLSAKPWWKRPSPWWILALTPLATTADGATLGPRVEILTMLVCDHVKPEYTAGHGMEDLGVHPWTSPALSALSLNAWPKTTTPTLNAPLNVPSDTVLITSAAGMNDETTPIPNPGLCKTDPVVQAAVAKLQGTMLTLQGILGVVTVGWWASLSDRYGRARIIGLSMCAIAFEDLVFIFVSMYAKRLPVGYWSLLIAPMVTGTLGGTATLIAAIHAYIADSTSSDDRSRMFSLLSGTLFSGMAIGPAVGGQLIKYTSNILTTYYFAFVVYTTLALAVWSIVPPSRSAVQLAASRDRHSSERAASAAVQHSFVRRSLIRVLEPLRPLAALVPAPATGDDNLTKGRRDFRLTIFAIALGLVLMITGGLLYHVQYVLARYEWTSVEVGYWLSSISITRAVFLTVGLPAIIKFLKPKKPAIQLPVDTDEPLAGSSASPASRTPRETGMLQFDLGLARASLCVLLVGSTLIPFAQTGPQFIGLSIVNSFGSGFGPAANAVALELFSRQPGRSAAQAGTLFGAIAVLQAISADVLGPALYGGVYFVTVRAFPSAIWFLNAVLVGISLGLLLIKGGKEIGEA